MARFAKQRIACFTAARSEYGLLAKSLRAIHDHPDLELLLYVSGAHLSAEHGYTAHEIERDGIPIRNRLFSAIPATPLEQARAAGNLTTWLAERFSEDRPDILLLLGDRYEAYAAAQAAHLLALPIAHIHGGEESLGSLDNGYRHCLSKLAWWHFPSTDVHADNLLRLGEPAAHILRLGSPASENALRLNTASLGEINSHLNLSLKPPFLLFTFHPVTALADHGMAELTQALLAIESFPQLSLVMTAPAAELGAAEIFQTQHRFATEHRDRVHWVPSLGNRLYLSALLAADGCIGNSSSGLIEAACLRKGAINIGRRQEGRYKPSNVLDSEAKRSAICAALDRLLSTEFQNSLRTMPAVYGAGDFSRKLVEFLCRTELPKTLQKRIPQENLLLSEHA